MTFGEFLFDKRHLQLRGLECHVIYVLPLDLAYGRIAGTLQNRYGNIPLIPMVEIRTRPPNAAPHQPGMEVMRQLVHKRMHYVGIDADQAFEAGVLDALICASGGEPRQLMHLIRQSLDYGKLPISKQASAQAIMSARKTLRRPMGKEDWQIIRDVANSGELPKDSQLESRVRELIINRQILQYSNGEEWFAPSPLLGDPPQYT
jgi:hypothetical protein